MAANLDADPPPKTSASMRYAGMGFDFAAAVAGFCILGWWIDRHWQIENHWGLLICAFLGLIGGTYNFIRQAIQASREANEAARRQRDDAASDNDRSKG